MGKTIEATFIPGDVLKITKKFNPDEYPLAGAGMSGRIALRALRPGDELPIADLDGAYIITPQGSLLAGEWFGLIKEGKAKVVAGSFEQRLLARMVLIERKRDSRHFNTDYLSGQLEMACWALDEYRKHQKALGEEVLSEEEVGAVL